jgi:hypothetical protein
LEEKREEEGRGEELYDEQFAESERLASGREMGPQFDTGGGEDQGEELEGKPAE